MKLRQLIQIGVVLASLLLIISNTDAQMSSELWITVSSDSCGDLAWHMLFGNHINATYGIDSLNPRLQEAEMPPAEVCLMTIWRNIPGRTNIWGIGLLLYDFRGVPTNINQKDTFRLSFASYLASDADITIHWPNAAYLRERCDSMFIYVPSEQIPMINAFSVDSLIIPDAGDRNISYLYIYKYGCKIIDDVNQKKEIIPITFALQQNYPNPFNPSTQITYYAPKATDVILKIYDVLGREIAVLINERKQAGEYNVTWSAEGVPGGVYFYRIVAGEFVETKKMVVMK